MYACMYFCIYNLAHVPTWNTYLAKPNKNSKYPLKNVSYVFWGCLIFRLAQLCNMHILSAYLSRLVVERRNWLADPDKVWWTYVNPSPPRNAHPHLLLVSKNGLAEPISSWFWLPFGNKRSPNCKLTYEFSMRRLGMIFLPTLLHTKLHNVSV